MSEINCLLKNIVELLVALGFDSNEAKNLSETEAMILCISKLSAKSNTSKISYTQRKYMRKILSMLGVDSDKTKGLVDAKIIILCIYKLSDKLYAENIEYSDSLNEDWEKKSRSKKTYFNLLNEISRLSEENRTLIERNEELRVENIDLQSSVFNNVPYISLILDDEDLCFGKIKSNEVEDDLRKEIERLKKDVEFYQKRGNNSFEQLKKIMGVLDVLNGEKRELERKLFELEYKIKMSESVKQKLRKEIKSYRDEDNSKEDLESNELRSEQDVNGVILEGEECVLYLNGLYNNILFINGECKTVKELANISNLSEDIILNRYKNGIRGSVLVTRKSQSTQKYANDNICVNGVIHSALEWIDIIGNISYPTVKKNIKSGKNNIDIFTKEGLDYDDLHDKVLSHKSTIKNESLIDLKRFDFVWNNNLRTVSRLTREFIEIGDYKNTPDNLRKSYKLIAFGLLKVEDDSIVFTRLGTLFRMALGI